MENFECKAPMYVDFVQSSVLDESDDADKLFDVLNDGQIEQQYEGPCQVKEEPPEDESDLLQIKNEQLVCDQHDDTITVKSAGMDEGLNMAMINLPLASGKNNIQLSAGTTTSRKKVGTHLSVSGD